MKNNGKEYEAFVANLQKALINSEEFLKQKNIQIQLNKKITDNFGTEREFDIYWEYELAGIVYKTVIECKDYNSKVSIDKIDALVGKTRDIPDLKAVFATKKGYQSGAEIKAKFNKVDLLIVREQNDSDWYTSDGIPLVRKARVNIHVLSDRKITSLSPMVDMQWANEESVTELTIDGLSDEIYINNLDINERKSIYDIVNHYESDTESSGDFYIEKSFSNAWLECKNTKYKIKGIKIGFSTQQPSISTMEIDFTKELVGVIEYVSKGMKTSIFNEGVIKESSI